MGAQQEAERAAQALKDSEYRYRNLFQAMAAAFWELDFSGVGAMLRQLKAQGVRDYPAHFAAHPEFVREMMRATRVLDVNDQTVALFGRGDKAEMLTNVEPFWPEASAHVFAASVIAAISGKPSYAAECKLQSLDGREFDVLFTACFAPEAVAAGKLLIGVIDITERVQAQLMLQRVQAEFAHAARVSVLGELTASIAHEVNQPLAAISTNAAAGLRWLDRPTPDLEELRLITERIIADAGRAADIVSRVRGMAMRGAPERTAFCVNELVDEAALFLRHELQAQGVTLRLELDRVLPPLRADRTQIQQVLVNLAVNAIQAMSGGARRELTIRTQTDGEAVSVWVEDTGPGVAEEVRARLFESFFTTKPSGMGMGLPICRNIVEAHGGAIAVSNRADGGACFLFTLPASLA